MPASFGLAACRPLPDGRRRPRRRAGRRPRRCRSRRRRRRRCGRSRRSPSCRPARACSSSRVEPDAALRRHRATSTPSPDPAARRSMRTGVSTTQGAVARRRAPGATKPVQLRGDDAGDGRRGDAQRAHATCCARAARRACSHAPPRAIRMGGVRSRNDRYVVELRDAAGAVVFEGRAQGLALPFPVDARAQAAERYAWTVTVVGDSALGAPSRAGSFVLAADDVATRPSACARPTAPRSPTGSSTRSGSSRSARPARRARRGSHSPSSDPTTTRWRRARDASGRRRGARVGSASPRPCCSARLWTLCARRRAARRPRLGRIVRARRPAAARRRPPATSPSSASTRRRSPPCPSRSRSSIRTSAPSSRRSREAARAPSRSTSCCPTAASTRVAPGADIALMRGLLAMRQAGVLVHRAHRRRRRPRAQRSTRRCSPRRARTAAASRSCRPTATAPCGASTSVSAPAARRSRRWSASSRAGSACASRPASSTTRGRSASQPISMLAVMTWAQADDTAALRRAFAGKVVFIGALLPFVDRHRVPVALGCRRLRAGLDARRVPAGAGVPHARDDRCPARAHGAGRDARGRSVRTRVALLFAAGGRRSRSSSAGSSSSPSSRRRRSLRASRSRLPVRRSRSSPAPRCATASSCVPTSRRGGACAGSSPATSAPTS